MKPRYTKEETSIINQAKKIMETKFKERTEVCAPSLGFRGPSEVADYCSLKIADLEHEVFCMLLLDTQHRLKKWVTLFTGTIDGASVYPREVVKLVLKHNASAVILAHNHPSGTSEPSIADITITERLSKALELIDVQVLDHVIVTPIQQTSLSARGLL